MSKKATALALVATLLSVVIASAAARPTLAIGQRLTGLQSGEASQWPTIDDQFAAIAR